MRNTITRSFNKAAASSLIYIDGKIEKRVFNVPYIFNSVELAEKYIRKHSDSYEGKLVEVISVEKVSTLYGMDERDFITKAKKVDARSKETRGTISKTVKAFTGKLLYMDEKRSVKDDPVFFLKGDKLDTVGKNNTPKGGKYICIEEVQPIDVLCVMTEEEFLANAREMVDYQHYVIK